MEFQTKQTDVIIFKGFPTTALYAIVKKLYIAFTIKIKEVL